MRYLIKKTSILALTLILISFLVFLAFAVIPGDPALSSLGTEAEPARLEALREEMGLNDPLPVRYGNWLIGLAGGDMGESYSYHLPVAELIGEKVLINITLTLLAFLFILIISIPAGILAARFKGRAVDRILMTGNQVVMAFPVFFVGILFTYFFGIVLKWFVPGGYVSYQEDLPGFIGYMILPAAAVALPKCAMTIRFLRDSITVQLEQDYVRTAYSRGNKTNGVLYRHVLRNAFMPVLTFLGMVITEITAGSLVIEQVFGIPGLGRLLITSISSRDYPVVQAIIIWIAGLIIVINFIVDYLYRLLDPRLRAS